MSRKLPYLLLLVLALASPGFATGTLGRYALILEDQPAAKTMPRGGRRDAPEVLSARQNIRAKQTSLRAELKAHGFTVTGSVDTLLNAVFVKADRKDLAALQSLPGVRYVRYLPPAHMDLNAAVNLVDAPKAWTILGGTTNAGAGIKIAIIDTGIDQTHPAFQDASLQTPAGFPLAGSNAAFTNTKVIVARSYVAMDAAGTNPADPSADSRPDDYSPRDRVGHGTSVAMAAAGNTNTGPLATITGLAPHAYLGNYKVFGSPGINGFASTDGIVTALEDAFNDGMNVAVLSLGGAALSGPLDSGATCGISTGSPCDPIAAAAENAVQQNMVVVAAAGNEAENGTPLTISLATIGSPADAPSVIAAAATNNSHQFFAGVHIAGPNVPAALENLNAQYGTGPQPIGVFSAPLRDASTIGDAFGCSAYPASSLSGDIALIQRGPETAPCTFDAKVTNAQNAGAVGMLLLDYQDSSQLPAPDVPSAVIPVFVVGYADGQSIKTYLASEPGAVTAGLDPSSSAIPDPTANQVAPFSSRGPALGAGSLKPDVAAPGTNIYTAAQNYDPNGEVYSANRYIVVNGTSFSTPIVGGIAALVRQKYPSLTALQVRSAIVNTATSDAIDPDTGASASVTAVGGGKAEATNALTTNVVIEPATLSYGVLSSFHSASQNLTLTNISSVTVSLTLSVSRTNADAATQLTVSPQTLTLTAGQSGTVAVTLSGSTPVAGSYEGSIQISGAAVPLHVPFLYLVGNGVAANLIPLFGTFEIGTVNQSIPDQFAVFQVVDKFGVPIAGAPVTWNASGGGSLSQEDTTTDSNGLAGAMITLGPNPGDYTYSVTVSPLATYSFTDSARALPTLPSSGVVNAASFSAGSGIAPGSIVSLFGTGLADSSQAASVVPLPISMVADSVSFDAANGSFVGALYYVSPGQVNVQVPWELTGQSSVLMKVNVDFSAGTVASVPVLPYAPALFAFQDSQDGQVAAALDQNNKLVSSTNAVARGQIVQLYCNGLGPVNNTPATGAAAPSSPLSTTTTLPIVTIGGQPAVVQFSGLAPGFVGLYQVNVQVPSSIAAAGLQPVAITVSGVAAAAVNLRVK